MGDSARAAVDNAFDLLNDYFLLCARDGMTYGESWRPMSARTYVDLAYFVTTLAARSVATRLLHRSTHHRGIAEQYFREPVQRSPFGGLLPH